MRKLLFIVGLFSASVGVAQIISSDADIPLSRIFMANQRNNFLAKPPEYFAGFQHGGVDLLAPFMTSVCSPVNGKIVYCSPTGWDPPETDKTGSRLNMAFIIQADAPSFPCFVVLGHLLRPLKDGKPISDDEVRKYRQNDQIKRGEIIGNIGNWNVNGKPCPHLHVGVYCNPNDHAECPKDHLGMLPLDWKDEVINNIHCCHNWWDPVAWLHLSIGSAQISNYLVPTLSFDQETLYFVREDSRGKMLMSLKLADKTTSEIGKINDNETVESMFPGPPAAGQIFLVTKTSGGEELWLATPGKTWQKLLSATTIAIGHYRTDTPYLPVKIGDKWQGLDLIGGQLKSVEELLPADGSRGWELIGSTNDDKHPKSYLARVAVFHDRASTQVLLEDDTASLESMSIISPQQIWGDYGGEAKDVVWLRQDMSGSSIWTSVLPKSPLSFLGVGYDPIPDFDKHLMRCVYRSKSISSLCATDHGEIYFSEQVNGRFRIRSIYVGGKVLEEIVY